MDPVTMIVAALTAGAVAGAQGTASEAVKDAYKGLKSIIARLVRGRAGAELALAEHEGRPDRWAQVLEGELLDIDAGQSNELIHAAENLLRIIDPDGSDAGKYSVRVSGSQGVQTGDGNYQSNYFGQSPRS